MTDHSYTAAASDWRGQLKKNNARTRWVICIFLIIYIIVGLIIDLFIHASGYSAALSGNPYAAPLSIEQILIALITFKITPWATIIMLGVGLISVWITYAMYNQIMLLGTEYIEVPPNSEIPELKKLYNVVEEMKVAAGLQYMPKVFLINADYMNAFASGYSEKSAMVAITKGLLEKLDRAELQAVMAHELSHIRHGDIKLTLAASVLSNLMLMAIDMLFYGIIFGGRDRDERRGTNVLALIIIVARFVLPLITVLLMLYLSRTREYMADAGCVELQRDNDPLIRALIKIHNDHQDNADQYAAAYQQTPHEAVRRESYIYDPTVAGLRDATSPSEWFSTHPDIKKRLQALGYKSNTDTHSHKV